MAKREKSERICPNGHKYFKSSDCPVCPVCESLKVPAEPFLKGLSAPARRALEGAGIHSIRQLCRFRESEIRQLHGMGPNALGKLKAAMADSGLSFKK
jgi:hypothetical protein